jgi:nucleoside-diphosphate-sugar epimerase
VKALVIGGTGPTGPLVVEGLLRRGYEVTLLHRGKHEVEFLEPVEHLHGDPHFIEPLKEALGARTFDLVIGMYGRLRYVAEAVKKRTPRFIAIGGMPYRVFVEGEKSRDGVPLFIGEDAPLFRDEKKNKFTYLMTLSEEIVMDAHREGYYAATILRFPMIYGPRQVAPREWCILRRILDGRKHLIIPDGGLKLERRGYAENVAHAVLLAVDKPKESEGEIFNVGDETIWSLRTWVELITYLLNHKLKLISMPFAIARPSRPYAGRSFHWVPDIEKIKIQLGYRDIVPPQEGLKRTIQWILENRPKPGGEIERGLGDSFDYEAEDRLIRYYEENMSRIRESVSGSYRFRHAYEHPKKEER